jgi:membrane protein
MSGVPTESTAPDPGGHPRDMPGGFAATGRGTLAGMKRHDVPSLAAAGAFKIFLSLFPGAVAAVAIFSLIGDPARLLGQVEGLLPDEVATLLEERVLAVADTGGAGLLAVAGVLGGLWAASSAAATVMKALNRINAVTEDRSFVVQRLTALAITLGLLVALGALLALVVLGPQLQALLLPEDLLAGVAGPLLTVLQLAGAVVVLVVLFAFIYWIGPAGQRARWQWWSPGALVGVVGWLLASAGFSIYTQTAGDYEATYAGLAGVIVTLIWLQLSMTVLLVGAEVNAERRRQRARATAVEDAAGAALVEPTSEPLAPRPTRLELPAPATTPTRAAPARAALAAAAGVAAAVTAVVTTRVGGRR